jgi:hypothetical protein
MTAEPVALQGWRPSFRWSAVAVAAVGIVSAYLWQHSHIHKYSLRNLDRFFAAPNLSPNTDDYPHVFEAEKAAGESWTALPLAQYSGGRAVYAKEPGRRLTWPCAVEPGEYQILLSVWAYAEGGENAVELTVGDQTVVCAWPSGKEGPRHLTPKIRLGATAHEISLRTTAVGQFAAVVDVVALAPHREATALWSYVVKCRLAVAAVLVSALCWGVFLLSGGVRALVSDPFARLLLGMALGLGFLAVTVTVLGTLHVFHRGTVYPLLVGGVLLGLRTLWRDLCALASAPWSEFSPGWWIAATPLGLIVLLLLLTAPTPAAGIDPQIYHLPIASWLIRDGGFFYHPYQIFWAYPHNTSNLFALAQLFIEDPFFRPCALLHGCLGALWLAAVYATGKAWFDRWAGLVAAALCLGIEGVVFQFGSALVDLGFAFFSTAVILVVLYSVREERPTVRFRGFLFAAVLAGVAAGCKVHGPVPAIALAVTVAAWYAGQRRWRAAFGMFFLLGAIAVAVASPMYVKNWLVWGNPHYPLTTFFNNRDLAPQFTRDLVGSNTAQNYWSSPAVTAIWPVTWVLKKFVDPLSPGPALLVGAVVLVALGRTWWRANWPLLLFTGAQILFWFSISPLTRFAYPWLSVMFVLAAAPVALRTASRVRLVIPLALLIAALPVLLVEAPGLSGKLRHLWNRESNEIYLSRTLRQQATPTFMPPLRAFSDLNVAYRQAKWPGRVLVDSNLTAYAEFPTVPGTYYFKARTYDSPLYKGAPLADYRHFFNRTYSLNVSPDDWLSEVCERLNVDHVILSRRNYPPTQNEPTRCDQVLDAFVRAELAVRREYADYVLYSFSRSAVDKRLREARVK